MSNLEKAKEHLRNLPKDYTYSEARQLLNRLGFDLAKFLNDKGDL